MSERRTHIYPQGFVDAVITSNQGDESLREHLLGGINDDYVGGMLEIKALWALSGQHVLALQLLTGGDIRKVGCPPNAEKRAACVGQYLTWLREHEKWRAPSNS